MIFQTPKPKGSSSIPSLSLYYLCIEDNTFSFNRGGVLVLVGEFTSMRVFVACVLFSRALSKRPTCLGYLFLCFLYFYFYFYLMIVHIMSVERK